MKSLPSLGSDVVLNVVTLLLTSLFVPSLAFPAPVINWKPREVVETIEQGQEKTSVVSFTSNQNLNGVAVSIVPALSPYVSVVPSSFAAISAGQALTITLTSSIPVDAPFGILNGTLQLRNARKPKVTYSVPLPITLGQCRESTSERLLEAAATNDTAFAVFHDSWQLAVELGFDPALKSVTECARPDNLITYTALLASVDGNPATLSLILGGASDSKGAWAPIIVSPGKGNVKIFDRSGGLLIEALDTEEPTVTELDLQGNPINATLVPQTSINFQPSPGCENYFHSCAHRELARQVLGRFFEDSATTALSLLGCHLLVEFPPAYGACVAGFAANSLRSISEIFLDPFISSYDCVQRIIRSDEYRCGDYPNVCGSYGQCAASGGTLVCIGIGDRCKRIGTDLVCEEASNEQGFVCGPTQCGDGIPNPTTGEKCDPKPGGAKDTGPCVITDINAPPGPENCAPARCGDGHPCIEAACVTGPGGAPEECDRGVLNSDSTSDACRTNCGEPFCGDGTTDPGRGEACDDGGLNSDTAPDRCRTSCTLPRCGDGITDPGQGEVCDDGNNIDGDGCSSNCQVGGSLCGNGNVDPGEQCDDGNQVDGDGCSSTCQASAPPNLAGNWVVTLQSYTTIPSGTITRSFCDGTPTRTDSVGGESYMPLPWCFQAGFTSCVPLFIEQNGTTLSGSRVILGCGVGSGAGIDCEHTLSGSVSGNNVSLRRTWRVYSAVGNTLVTYDIQGVITSASTIEGTFSGTLTSHSEVPCTTIDERADMGTGTAQVTISP